MLVFLAISNFTFCQTNTITDVFFPQGNKTHDFRNLTESDLVSFGAFLRQRLREEQQLLVNIDKMSRTFGNTIIRYDQIADEITKGIMLFNLIGICHNNEALRTKSLEELQQLATQVGEFNNDPGVSSAITDYSNSTEALQLDGISGVMLERVIKNFKTESDHKGKIQQDSLQDIEERLYKLQIQFQNNIRNDLPDTLFLTTNDLSGIPAGRLVAAIQTETGCWFPVNATNYRISMESSISDSLKGIIFRSFHAQGEKTNPALMKKILQLRKQKARILGFETFSDYILHNKILNDPQKVDSLLQLSITQLRPSALDEYRFLLTKKQKTHSPDASELFPWEINRLISDEGNSKEKNSSDSYKRFFNMNTVTNGLFNLADKLFQLQFQQIEAKGWHSDVKLYSVIRNGKVVGRVYFDLLARPGKFPHKMALPIQLSRNYGTSQQIPVVVLLLNFQPYRDGSFFIQDYSDLESIFHEFGHAIHFLLGESEYSTLSVSHCSSEVTESVAKFFQLFCRNWVIMGQIFEKADIKDRLSETVYNKMIQTDIQTLNMRKLNTTFNAYFDFYLHNKYDPMGESTVTQVYDSLQSLIDIWPAIKEGHNESSFYHFTTMPCDYYTYILTDQIAQKWFNVFWDGEMMHWDMGPVFERMVLRQGAAISKRMIIQGILDPDLK